MSVVLKLYAAFYWEFKQNATFLEILFRAFWISKFFSTFALYCYTKLMTSNMNKPDNKQAQRQHFCDNHLIINAILLFNEEEYWLLQKIELVDYRKQCIDILTKASGLLRTEYGVKSLRIFGSVARGEDKIDSDVDIFVDMPPKALKMVALKNYLQNLLGRSVDIVRSRATLDSFLQNEIHKDGITIFA